MALSQKLETPIRLPRCWQELLNIEELPADTAKARGTAVDDPDPYRDDVREVTIKEGDWQLSARLCSGSSNYWLEWEVDGPGDIQFISEPDESIIPGDESIMLDTDEGNVNLAFRIETY